VAGDPAATAGWELRDLPIESGYAAALAVHGSVSALRLWQWSA
jgi:hypothetical protein